MFKKELKFNFKSFIIWLSILLGILLVTFLIYPSIANSDNIKMMDQMMTMFPEEMLKAFNMDISSMDSAYGWLKSEGFVMILLIIGSYAGIMGSNILLKEESEKTIEYVNSLPIKRKEIVISKYLVGIIYISLMVLILGVFNYIGLSLSGDFDKLQFILLSIAPLFPGIVIFSLCMFISTFARKTKKMLGISLGIVFISYILNALSEIAETTEFLKYLSIFTLADIRNIIIDIAINPIMIIITIVSSCLLLVLSLMHFERKDLV